MTIRLRGAVFSRESRGRLKSIDDQDRLNSAVADDLNADVLHTLRDKVSASRFGTRKRDGWPEVTKLVVGGRIDVLIVFEISRSDRVMDTWVPFLTACRDHGVLIHVTSEETTYDPRKAVDRKRLLDAGTDAEYETEKLSKRTRKGTAGAALAGKPHGKPGFGYSRLYDPHDRKVFEDQPNEHAPVAREIIERVARRDPVSTITDDLNRRRAGDRKWSRKAVKLLATNPRYIGIRDHNGEQHKAAWPGIVDEAVFWRAVAVLGEPDRKESAPGSLKFLLSYLAVCSRCGEQLNVNAYMERARPRYKCPRGHQSVGMGEADWYVAHAVLTYLAQPENRRVFARGGEALQQARADKARLERLLEEARDAYDRDEISTATMSRKEKALAPQLAAARERVLAAERADVVPGLLGDVADLSVDDDPFTEHVGWKRWEGLGIAAQRAVLKAVCARIELHPTGVRLNAHSTDEERELLASERVSVSWVGE